MRLALLLFMVLAIPGLVVNLARETAASRVTAMARRLPLSAAEQTEFGLWLQLCAFSCPLRGRLAIASIAAEQAMEIDSAPVREAQLRQAAGQLAVMARQEPLNSEIPVVQAYVSSLDDFDAPSAATLGWLEDSYRKVRFSRSSSAWRLRFCGAVWPSLTPWLRERALDEAEWLWAVDKNEHNAITRTFANPAAQAALQARLGAPFPSVTLRR